MVEERVWSLGGEVLSEASSEKGQVSVKTKLAFSSGSLEEAMIGAAGVATMIFYNQVRGGSPAL